MKLLDRNEIEKSLDIKFLEKNLLITFHPVTLENDTAAKQMEELLRALRNLQDTFLIFTIPNTDTGGRILIGAFGNQKDISSLRDLLGSTKHGFWTRMRGIISIIVI